MSRGPLAVARPDRAGSRNGGDRPAARSPGPQHQRTAPPPPPPPEPPPPPPPPPAPPPPVPPASDYVVYFGFDQAAVTPEADEVLAKASQDIADRVKDVAVVRQIDAAYQAGVADYRSSWNRWNAAMGGRGDAAAPVIDPKDLPDPARYAAHETIVGYTDTAGTADYNQRLSERRAKAVADALVAKGAAADGISVEGKGKADPAVATGDGVREPLNRRVTIHIG